MKTSKELKDKIASEIAKSGYPLEFHCQQLLMKNAWGISPLKHFVTPEGEDREIDIEANHSFVVKKQDKEITVFVTLLIECKKNHTNPWVFFQDIVVARNVNVIGETERDEIETRRHYSDKDIKLHCNTVTNMSKSYVVPFKQEDSKETRQIYEGVSKVVNSFSYEYSRQKNLPRQNRSRHHIHFYFLAVVFDGNLLIAEIKKDKVKIDDASHILLGVSRSEQRKINNFVVDIVHKDYFDKYLKILDGNNKYIAQLVERI